MNFFFQIGMELKNILRSKFILITAIIALAASVALPLAGTFLSGIFSSIGGSPMPMYALSSTRAVSVSSPDNWGGQEPVTIDGIVINPDNPFYWNLVNYEEEKKWIERDTYLNEGAKKVTLALMETEKSYYITAAGTVQSYEDYRIELVWRGREKVMERTLYNMPMDNPDDVYSGAMYRFGMNREDFDKKYVNSTPAERQAQITALDEFLARLESVFVNKDFEQFIAVRVEQEEDQIKSIESNIAIQEKTIIDFPEQEESVSQYIEEMRRQINNIRETTIPMLYFRLEKNIKPNSDRWENAALNDIENYKAQLNYTKILTEQEFAKEVYLVQQYKTYGTYVEKITAQINEFNNNILIAENSLNAGKPDMKFVQNGARNATNGFLSYSIFVAFFGVLVAGFMIANEFQTGTIRLLMIRPRTRTKVLLSKFLAALLLCVAIYFAGTVLNMLTNGIMRGFEDFAFPNYTVTGEIPYIAVIVPRILACTVPIIFAFCVAFMLSTLIKNAAIAITIPAVSYIASSIAMTNFSNRAAFSWLAYTPIPYLNIADFFQQYSQIINTKLYNPQGMTLDLAIGIPMLLILAFICVIISVLVFRKQDITN